MRKVVCIVRAAGPSNLQTERACLRGTVKLSRTSGFPAARVECGEATDAEVALALGMCIHAETFRETFYGENDYVEHDYYCKACGIDMAKVARRVPPFTTCLTTLAKECERRGYYAWTLGKNVFHGYWHASINAVDDTTAVICIAGSNATDTPTQALCAALVRAVEGEAK